MMNLLCILLLTSFAGGAGRDDTLTGQVGRYLHAEDAGARNAVAAEIARDFAQVPAAELSRALRESAGYEPHKPGEHTIQIPLEDGSSRTVFVRVPKKYDPRRSWPLIIAYHGTGGTGRDLIEPLARRLGGESEQYLIAGVDQYQPNNVDSKRSWRPEHRLVIHGLRQRLNVDDDRVYTIGFSGGGYVAWSMAIFYGDEIAGSIPVGSAFDAAPEIPGLWEMLLPNVRNTPVLNVWGSNDRLPVLGIDLRTPQGTNHELNQKLEALVAKMGLPIRSCVVQGGGHDFEVPRAPLLAMLKNHREQFPRLVRQRFRYLNQARASWLEGLSWHGDQWGLGARQLPEEPGETREQAIASMIDSTLGTLKGTIDGQNITIEHSHLGELMLWFGDGMVDWSKPVRVTANGKVVSDGMVVRDVRVALSQARRTRDFARLRFAGLKISRDGSVKWFDPERDDLPQVIWEKPGG